MNTRTFPGTWARLIIGLLLPVFLVLLVMNGLSLFARPDKALQFLGASFIFGYYIMGIPSLMYTVLMEFAVNRRLNDDYWVWAIGAILGTFSGLIFWDVSSSSINVLPLFGCVAGGITAYILRRHFKQRLRIEPTEPLS